MIRLIVAMLFKVTTRRLVKVDRADYSAITTWGVFQPVEETGEDHIILLDAVGGRWEFPELKEAANDLFKEFDPDMILIEQKGSGMPLTQELRRMGIPVTPFHTWAWGGQVYKNACCAPLCLRVVWCGAPDTEFC